MADTLQRQSTIKAFTLFELLITLVIFVSLAVIGVGGFRYVMQRQQLAAIGERLLQATQFARLASVTNDTDVTLCGSRDGQRCDGQWSRGQIVMLSQAHRTLVRLQALPPQITLSWHGSLHADAVKFMPSGRTSAQGTFVVQALHWPKLQLRCVLLRSGRARLERNISRETSTFGHL